MNLINEKIERKLSFAIKDCNTENNAIYIHWHTNDEICMVSEGMCDFIISDTRYTAKKGDIVVIKSGEIHRFDSCYGDCRIFVCTFEPTFLYNLRADTNAIPSFVQREAMEKEQIYEEIVCCFKKLLCENDNMSKSSELIFRGALLQICGLLLKHYEKGDSGAGDDMSKLISFQKILEYIFDNYSENITLDTVASQFGYNPVYLSGKFKRRMGINFKKYLDNIRIAKAGELLLTSDKSVSEISLLCGYENIRTFNNVFKKITGTVPSSIKKRK